MLTTGSQPAKSV